MRNPLVEFLAYRFNLDEDKAEEEEIISSIRKNVEFKGTNLWALIFAIFIASIGLNVNSTAVIIGAMLISPIMGPIMGVGLGLGIFDSALIKLALKNLLIAVVISLLASTLYFFISPLHEAQSELLARTRPTIWDVLIALFGGLAGVIASTRKNISNTIPGVAIATALMPPICTAGFGLATGNLLYFAGAFYLFLINCVFISISTFLIIRFLNFKPVTMVDEARQKKIRKMIWYVAALTIIPSIYLAYIFVNEEIFKQKASRFINSEVKTNGFYVLDKNIDLRSNSIILIVYGNETNDSIAELITQKKYLYGLEDTKVVLQRSHTVNSNDLNNFRDDIREQFLGQEVMVNEKDNKIKVLEKEVRRLKEEEVPPSIYNEFVAIYGEISKLTAHQVPLWSKTKTDTVLLVYVKLNGKPINGKPQQIENWIKARLSKDQVKVVIEP
jgi:uncharacterized hydrophobic protein (TIGR00271 family)